MNFIKFPIVPILFGLLIGILTQNFLKLTLIEIGISIGISVIGFLLFYFYNQKRKKHNHLFTVFTFTLSISFGIFSSFSNNESNSNKHFSNFILEKNIIQGLVIEKLKPTKYYNKFIIKTNGINSNNCIGKIICYIPKELNKNIEVGNQIKLFKTPQLLQENFNPNQFNYSNYLNKQNVFHEIKVKDSEKVIIRSSSNGYTFINIFKSKLLNSYPIESFKKDNYNLLMALLFGEKTELSKDLSNNYANAGIIHILAISGLHIALIYGIILWLTKPLQKLRKGKISIFIISLSILWFYALLAGFSASIVRAVVMFSIIALAKVLNRQNNVYNSLALSAFVLLLINPNYVFDIGFQLSFAAVLSIVIFQPLVRKYSYSKYYLIRETKSLLLISLVAQIGVLPLTLYYFGQFPLLFLVANVVAIPLSSVILILGLILIPLNFLLPQIAIKVSIFVNYLIEVMNKFTTWIVQFESFIIKNIAFHEVLVFLMYLIIASFIYFAYFPKIKNMKPILATVIVFQFGYFYLTIREENNDEFVIFNIMKSNLFVETKNNASVFYTNNIENSKTTIDAYIRGKFVKNYKVESLKNAYAFKKKILCIDSIGIYKTTEKPEVVILTNSPKINLNRLISDLNPKQIIADGSNFKSYVKLWKETCVKEKIPFHATAEKGFYIIN
ncbi:ComEC/Rec2 family competence protein [Flavobacterium urocaniciphilum]|uniref:Competence protein ComEC n=1 Tax=Flavobacterium urocaniciphilum TaxID=1299341 RepID=A0A1H9DFH9_9FLAO|nr:ComEC/Rec2 family competence protein [Flavobacterium urocaniciphilum]SEQ12236.1 competence protein ComEC [Flavobacterium urocaniciphilum]